MAGGRQSIVVLIRVVGLLFFWPEPVDLFQLIAFILRSGSKVYYYFDAKWMGKHNRDEDEETKKIIVHFCTCR